MSAATSEDIKPTPTVGVPEHGVFPSPASTPLGGDVSSAPSFLKEPVVTHGAKPAAMATTEANHDGKGSSTPVGVGSNKPVLSLMKSGSFKGLDQLAVVAEHGGTPTTDSFSNGAPERDSRGSPRAGGVATPTASARPPTPPSAGSGSGSLGDKLGLSLPSPGGASAGLGRRRPSLKHLETNVVMDNQPMEVIPRLWIGSIYAALNREALEEHGVTHVLNISGSAPTFPETFTYLSIDLRDQEASYILSCIPHTNLFIQAGRKAGGVLVHCSGGRSRSATLIMAFVMAATNCTYDEALLIARTVRSVVHPNKGFEAQLRAYEEAGFDVHDAQQILLRRRLDRLARATQTLHGTVVPMTNGAADRAIVADAAAVALGHRVEPALTASAPVMISPPTQKSPLELTYEHKSIASAAPTVGKTAAKPSGGVRSFSRFRKHASLPDSLDSSMSSPTHVKDDQRGEATVRAAAAVSKQAESLAKALRGPKPTNPAKMHLIRRGSVNVRPIPPLRAMQREVRCKECDSLLFLQQSVLRHRRPGSAHTPRKTRDDRPRGLQGVDETKLRKLRGGPVVGGTPGKGSDTCALPVVAGRSTPDASLAPVLAVPAGPLSVPRGGSRKFIFGDAGDKEEEASPASLPGAVTESGSGSGGLLTQAYMPRSKSSEGADGSFDDIPTAPTPSHKANKHKMKQGNRVAPSGADDTGSSEPDPFDAFGASSAAAAPAAAAEDSCVDPFDDASLDPFASFANNVSDDPFADQYSGRRRGMPLPTPSARKNRKKKGIVKRPKAGFDPKLSAMPEVADEVSTPKATKAATPTLTLESPAAASGVFRPGMLPSLESAIAEDAPPAESSAARIASNPSSSSDAIITPASSSSGSASTHSNTSTVTPGSVRLSAAGTPASDSSGKTSTTSNASRTSGGSPLRWLRPPSAKEREALRERTRWLEKPDTLGPVVRRPSGSRPGSRPGLDELQAKHVAGAGQSAKDMKVASPESMALARAGVPDVTEELPLPEAVRRALGGPHASLTRSLRFDSAIVTARDEHASHLKCDYMFVEPLAWMGDVTAPSGVLRCPNLRCGSVLGGFQWAGKACSCKVRVHPAFYVRRDACVLHQPADALSTPKTEEEDE